MLTYEPRAEHVHDLYTRYYLGVHQ